VLVLAIALAATVAASCAGSDAPAATSTSQPQSGSSAPDTLATTPGSGPGTPGATAGGVVGEASVAPPGEHTGSGESVSIVFGGDVHFEGPLRTMLQAGTTTTAFEPLRQQFGDADLAMVNFESAITERGTAQAKAYTFRAPERALEVLRDTGVDVVTLANNHGLDFGPIGLQDTLAAKDENLLPMVGIGRDDTDAYAPWITTVKGQRIAVIGATQVIDSEFISSWTATSSQAGMASAKQEQRLVQAVRDARTKVDTVVVYLHWGTERQECPNPQQKALTPLLVDAGADVIVGGHAHRVLGGGRYQNAVVHYGLGNFVFFNQTGPAGDSGYFRVTITGRRVDGYQWTPARLNGFAAKPLTGADATRALATWDGLRACTGLTP
jgi:poly-gamma-glutamate synthesis protein (capsule biosynthesis protein)